MILMQTIRGGSWIEALQRADDLENEPRSKKRKKQRKKENVSKATVMDASIISRDGCSITFNRL